MNRAMGRRAAARSWARRAAVVLTLLAVGTSVGCAGNVDPLDKRVAPSADAPLPPGVEDPAKLPEVSEPDRSCGDPRRSLRPSGSLPRPGRMPAGSTMKRIQDNGRLVVGVDQNTYLFGFRDPANGEIVGFDPDIAREIARAVFGDPKKITFRAMSSAERIPAIQAGDVDIVVRTMTITCERWKEVAFSAEYYTAGQRVLVASDSTVKGIDDLVGKKVCAVSGTTSIQEIARRKAAPVAVRNWTDCLVLLQQHQVVAISTDNVILAGLAAQDPNTKVVGAPFTSEPYGIAMASDATDLTRFVNAVLERIRDNGAWDRIHQRWLTPTLGDSNPPRPRYR